MQDIKTWNMLSKHFAAEESSEDKEIFLDWFNKNEKNKIFFYKMKEMWDSNSELVKEEAPITFFGKFTKQKIKDFIFKQAIGNFVGFIVGMWVTAMFSHYVLERRGLTNLFGLAGRKKVAVHDIPEWLQGTISILVGFVALEFINHFFQTKKHLVVWEYLKNKYNSIAPKS